MIYTTNQPQIVDRAKQCVEQYHTIVNNIPKSNKVYNNTPLDFANMDNNLAKAQLAIGSSSNLAQICLTYMYNFDDQMYEDYLCILSVLAQVAIDNCKRQFDVDLTNEINYIKRMMNVTENGYPLFWLLLHPNFNRANIDKTLNCPMNYLYSLEIPVVRNSESTLPMSDFFIKHTVEKKDKLKNRKVEEIIDKYSLGLLEYNMSNEKDTKDEYLLLRSDFDDMIEEISRIYISTTYISLFSWLIDRAFLITPRVRANKKDISKINKNKSLLMKTLYSVNKKNLLECFKKDSDENE